MARLMAITAYIRVFVIDWAISGLVKTVRQAVVVNLEFVFIDLNAMARTGTIANTVALEIIVAAITFCLRVCRDFCREIVGLVDCSNLLRLALVVTKNSETMITICRALSNIAPDTSPSCMARK